MNPAGHLLRVGSSNRDRVDPQSDLEENLLEVFTLGLLKVASQDVLLSLRLSWTFTGVASDAAHAASVRRRGHEESSGQVHTDSSLLP